ncbi:hypothetical protein KEK_14438 [Mycolicibacterium thermoresistibile ATCC 19527]|uniref:Uncharacterized protein n=1 Tax=Mycolicibacterium thermoresistibile (strain ATCC 19527 / DSM 44167 / CIP 105390 / JCM 6362 / NCTC 10409 / 316) TaxID=1078020 RepID=G7CGZ5_MYCT3|nr:hypothetical protein KEK_14438 [Mycolicibacterium thermoresistibile ATCC 19527]
MFVGNRLLDGLRRVGFDLIAEFICASDRAEAGSFQVSK